MTEEEKQRTVRITNIQRFCLHDGPGIRTTVFLKGCSIHCPWCANPENIRYEVQRWKDKNGMEGAYGYDIPLRELEKELLKDRNYFFSDGGVTFSGGEPLLQVGMYEPLLYSLKEKGIHLTVETALFVEPEFVKTAMNYFDYWYVDMKILEPEKCFKILGGDVDQYKKNLIDLAKEKKDICIRIPCVPRVTDNKENIQLICYILTRLKIRSVEIFEVHNLGLHKYRSLGLLEHDFSRYDGPSAVSALSDFFLKNNIPFKEIRF